jgi:hypothetical protein
LYSNSFNSSTGSGYQRGILYAFFSSSKYASGQLLAPAQADFTMMGPEDFSHFGHDVLVAVTAQVCFYLCIAVFAVFLC